MNRVLPFILVGIGGFFGANIRFFISRFFAKSFELYFPFATLVTNILGCFLIGLFSCIVASSRILEPEYIRYAVNIGFIGAFTTFSTFEFELNSLFDDGATLLALLYIVLSIIIGLIALKLGLNFGKYLVKLP